VKKIKKSLTSDCFFNRFPRKSKDFIKEEPTISIITVVFNGEDKIEDTIKSVINQLYKNIEYIIIDGKSTDNTVNLIKKYDNYIDVLISEPDDGIYDAMNKGLNIANGDFVYFLNCGDIILEFDTIEKVSQLVKENPDKKLFYSDVINFDPIKKKGYIDKCSHLNGHLNHQGTIYRKELHNIFGQYYSSRTLLISDYIFFIQIPRDYFFKVNNIIARYDLSGITMNKITPIQFALFNYLIGKISFFNMISRIVMFKLFYKIIVKIEYLINRQLKKSANAFFSI
jgi:glycosyltransferase involved in cell wall biosynthesis